MKEQYPIAIMEYLNTSLKSERQLDWANEEESEGKIGL
jgi:hypothetical protein